MEIYFSKLEEKAIIPTKKHFDDAGWDFYSLQAKALNSKTGIIVRTGIRWFVKLDEYDTSIPYLQIKSRSGLGVKTGIEASNAGVIDCGYTGEIMIKLYNMTNRDYVVYEKDRVAQGIICLTPKITVEEIELKLISDIKNKSVVRGKNGFGSSGR